MDRSVKGRPPFWGCRTLATLSRWAAGALIAVFTGVASLTVAVMLVAGSGGESSPWARSQYSQADNTAVTQANVPALASLPAKSKVMDLAAGYAFTLAVDSTGHMWAWGDNSSGQLGNGTAVDSSDPVRVKLPADVTVTEIAAGDDHALALTSTGKVLAWGSNDYGQLGTDTGKGSRVPVEVKLPAHTTVAAIGTGAGHSLAVASSGRVLAWGHNSTGQLGTGDNADRGMPVPVDLPDGATATAVDGGSAHSIALASGYRMWSWGFNTYGQLGSGTSVTFVAAIAALLLLAGTAVIVATARRRRRRHS